MKSKLCLLAMCTSMFSVSSSVYGADTVVCPQYQGNIAHLNADLTLWAQGKPIHGIHPAQGLWTVDRSTLPANKIKKIDTQPDIIRDGSCLYKVESSTGKHDLKLIQIPPQ